MMCTTHSPHRHAPCLPGADAGVARQVAGISVDAIAASTKDKHKYEHSSVRLSSMRKESIAPDTLPDFGASPGTGGLGELAKRARALRRVSCSFAAAAAEATSVSREHAAGRASCGIFAQTSTTAATPTMAATPQPTPAPPPKPAGSLVARAIALGRTEQAKAAKDDMLEC